MEEVRIEASVRSVIGKQVKALRRKGLLPGVIYGRGFPPLPIILNAHDASLVLPYISSSKLIVLDVDGQPHNTIIRERQRNPLTGNYIHIDFLEISMTEKLRAEVQLTFEGEAPAVDNFDGIVVFNIESLEVEALPNDLPNSLPVDLSVLNEIGDSILVRDVIMPDGVELLTDPDEAIVVVTAPTVEKELEEIQPLDVEPEVIERGKREEEE
jgi:large subunit ribosomal protein L25